MSEEGCQNKETEEIEEKLVDVRTYIQYDLPSFLHTYLRGFY